MLAYYIEGNLIAVLFSFIIYFSGRSSYAKNETSQIIFNRMLVLLAVLSVFDFLSHFYAEKSRIIVEFSRLVYLILIAVGTYLWFLFILIKTNRVSNIKRTFGYTGGLLIFLLMTELFNPITSFYFKVNANAEYTVKLGIFFAWFVEWSCFIAAFIVNLIAVSREKSDYKKREYRGYLMFALPMVFSSIPEMLFEGISTMQVGFMFGLLLAFLNRQKYKVQRDSLTGLNNRNGFISFLDNTFSWANKQQFTLYLLDVDRFKSINDTYGHLKGDMALENVATALKNAVTYIPEENHPDIFRYGGDEFIIVCTNMGEYQKEEFVRQIHSSVAAINEQNKSKGEKFELTVSVGFETRECDSREQFEKLVLVADQAMYEVKNLKKVTR